MCGLLTTVVAMQPCSHAAMPDDAVDISKINANPGGKQRAMTDDELFPWNSERKASCIRGEGCQHSWDEHRQNASRS